jgi:SHOCT-like protein
MSSEERRKILQMVEEGRISPQEAASLMHALDEDADLVQEEVEVFQPESRPGFEGSSVPEFEEVRSRARRFAMIPLWTGVFIAVFSAWGIYSIQQSAGANFWFFCLMVPLLLGVSLIALSAGGEGSKWMYVNVDRRKAQDWPQNITLGFPLPLGLTAWFLRNFGHNIRGLGKTNVDEIIQVLDATSKSGAPFIVNVHDDEDGEHVQVYIG